MLSASGRGADGLCTEKGYYELASTGEGRYNILYTDYQTQTRIFLCNRPDCAHCDETCTSFLNKYGFLFPYEDKIGLFLFGTTLIDAPDEERRSRVYSMNYDGSGRKELFAMDPSVTVTSGMATDGRFFYFVATILDDDDWAKQSPELVKVDLASGQYQSLKKFDVAPFLGGAEDDYLIFETGVQKDNGFEFQYFTISLSDGQEHTFYKSPVQGFIQRNHVLFLNLTENVMTAVNALTGQTEQWPVEIPVGDKDSIAITGNGNEALIDHLYTFNLYNAGQQAKYLFDPQTGDLSPVTLTYAWVDGIQRPIHVLAQADDHLLVVNGSAIADIQYQKMDGTLETRQTVRTFYAFLSREDYLAGRPSYIPVQDMLDDLFVS